MYRVKYSYYGKYQKEVVFEVYAEAKKFFFSTMRRNGVTKAELIVPI